MKSLPSMAVVEYLIENLKNKNTELSIRYKSLCISVSFKFSQKINQQMNKVMRFSAAGMLPQFNFPSSSEYWISLLHERWTAKIFCAFDQAVEKSFLIYFMQMNIVQAFSSCIPKIKNCERFFLCHLYYQW